MSEREEDVRTNIQHLKEAYETLLQNSVLRPRLASVSLSDSQWREITHLLSHTDYSARPGGDVYGLYVGVRAVLALAHVLLSEVKPRLRSSLKDARGGVSQQDRVIVEMTAANLDSNVHHLVDTLSDVYVAISRLDSERNGERRAVRKEFPDLAESSAWQLPSSSGG